MVFNGSYIVFLNCSILQYCIILKWGSIREGTYLKPAYNVELRLLKYPFIIFNLNFITLGTGCNYLYNVNKTPKKRKGY